MKLGACREGKNIQGTHPTVSYIVSNTRTKENTKIRQTANNHQNPRRLTPTKLHSYPATSSSSAGAFLSSIISERSERLAFLLSSLAAVRSINSTPSSITFCAGYGQRPAQYRIKAQALYRISAGFFSTFLSKYMLFLVFQIAQKIAANPKAYTDSPPGRAPSIHAQYCS
jgi:hypothetical protein